MAIDLFKNITDDMVNEVIRKLRKEAEGDRQEHANQRLRIYHDAWDGLLTQELKNHFIAKNYDRIKQSSDVSDNIFKKVVKLISQVYTEPVTRIYTLPGEKDTDGTAKEAKDFDPSIFFGGEKELDVFWKRINQYTELLNDLIIMPAWDAVNKYVRPVILTPDIVQVWQVPGRPEHIGAFAYTENYNDTASNLNEFVYFWSLENHFVLNANKGYAPMKIEGNENNENPYKDTEGRAILPQVSIHKDQIPGNYWNPTTGSDLFCGTIGTGVKRTSKNYLTKVNCFKQPWFIGLDKKIQGKLIFDPLSAVRLADGGSAGLLDNTADFKGLSDNIKGDVNALLGSYGLKAEDFKAPEAAKAIIIKNNILMKIRRGQIPYCRKAEQAYHYKAQIIYNYHTGNKLNVGLSIDYPEIEAIEDPAERLAHDKQKVTDGILNVGDFYMKYNPDCKSRDEAMSKVEQNAKDLKAFADAGFSMNDAIKAVGEI